MLTTTPTAAQLKAAHDNLKANAWVANGDQPAAIKARINDPPGRDQNR